MRLLRLLLFLPLLQFLAATSSLLAQDTTTNLIDRAASQYRTARTVHASFEQTLTSEATGTAHPARGEYFQSGKKFALRFTEPSGDAIVSDGTMLWLYLPSSVKGQVIKMPAEVGEGLDVLSALLSSPRTNYAIVRGKDETVDGHAATIYTLTPKRNDLPFAKATVWIGKSDGYLWLLDAVEQTGLVRHVRFKTVEINVDLPQGALTFSVPAGVRVIDQASLIGKKP